MTEGAAPALPARMRWAGFRRLWPWFRDNAAEERERWPLFAPVVMGCGVGIYFALPAEPGLWPALVIAAAGGALAFAGFRRYQAGAGRFGPGLVVAGLIAALLGAGLAVATIRTLVVAAPVLERPLPRRPSRSRSTVTGGTFSECSRLALSSLVFCSSVIEPDVSSKNSTRGTMVSAPVAVRRM